MDVEALPFQIPLGALIPQKTENLLAACKNIGTTHITNGCYRLHPVEWNIGEAAGNLAALCLEKNVKPRAVRNDTKLLDKFQKRLIENGFELEWREDLNLAEGDPHRHAMCFWILDFRFCILYWKKKLDNRRLGLAKRQGELSHNSTRQTLLK